MFGRGYNLPLAAFWLMVMVFVLARELILPPEAAAKLAGPNGWICAIVAGGFAVYNMARWWATRALRTRGVHVNPLAERLPDPDKAETTREPNPELDFTKREEKTEN
jgi:hypothetical protein